MKARCDVCGNVYDNAFQVVMNGNTHTFDSFECAIHALAPECGNCGVRVIGHGIEADKAIYCCANCAEAQGVHGAKDNVEDQ